MLVARHRKSNSKRLYNKAKLLIHARKSPVVNWLSGKAQSNSSTILSRTRFLPVSLPCGSFFIPRSQDAPSKAANPLFTPSFVAATQREAWCSF